MKKIFLVGGKLTFVKQDYRILKEKYDVDFFSFNTSLDIFIGIPKIIFGVLKCDIVYVWFGSILSAFLVVLSKMFNKKIIVVAGGYDVANEPSIKYGAMGHPIKKHFQKITFNNADVVLPVSKCSKKELLKETRPRSVKVVHNGVDVEKFTPRGKKQKKVITVVNRLNWQVFRKKGIKTFVLAASELPSTEFHIIGKITPEVRQHLRSIMSDNVLLRGFMNHADLLEEYRSAKVYAQLSKHESFGVALAEAMLCECVPVVAKTSALPEVAGKTGYYVKYGNVKDTVEKIKKALKSKKGKTARKRIKEKFSLKRRKKELHKLVASIKK